MQKLKHLEQHAVAAPALAAASQPTFEGGEPEAALSLLTPRGQQVGLDCLPSCSTSALCCALQCC